MSPEIRIGDAERDSAVTSLGEHYAAGRLTKEEYDERADRAWAARTNSDLKPLFLDLPSPGGAGSPHGRQDARRAVARTHPGRTRDRYRIPWIPLAVLLVGLSMLFDFPFWLILVAAFAFHRMRRC